MMTIFYLHVTNENMSDRPHLIFCDGACSGNPGPGGWAALLIFSDDTVEETGGKQTHTTNNQMELMAATEGLRRLGSAPGDAVIYTDSTYVIKGITQWIWGWKKKGWLSASGNPVLNQTYWEALDQACYARKSLGKIHWKYVAGHSGFAGNERVDVIAVEFSKQGTPSLFRGTLADYSVPVFPLPPDVALAESRTGSGEKKAPVFYVSLLGDVPMRHATWKSCEGRTKGRSGAKFKKVTSESEAHAVLTAWGCDPTLLKKD